MGARACGSARVDPRVTGGSTASQPMTVDPELAEELESACRTTVGDRLRSVGYFTTEDHEVVYLREDLEFTGSVDAVVANERLGFTSQDTYDDPELGPYRATIRVFEHGYLTRIIVEDHGVFVTTDEMEIERFLDLTEAVESILMDHA